MCIRDRAFAVALVAGTMEMVVAWFTGWVIDMATTQGPGPYWARFWPVVAAGAAFFLVIRPIIFAADAGTSSILLGPHLFPMVLSRINRHTLGHSMRYFENDFAGRISQKAMQTARGLTFSGGFGLKFFFGEWFAVRLDIRDQVLQQELLGESSIVNNITASLGLSIFMPFRQ